MKTLRYLTALPLVGTQALLGATYPIKHVSVSINRSPAEVYNYASNPENLPNWAAGVSGAKIHKEGEVWTADSPMGKVKIAFAPHNDLGVIDHDVTVPSGETTHNALRVIPNGTGSEIIFSVIKGAKATDKDFAKDSATILKDLTKLKTILETEKKS